MKISDGKRFFTIFLLLGFLIGILYANLFAEEYIISSGILNDYFLSQYSQIEIEAEKYLWYLIRLRFFSIVCVGALGCTRLKKPVVAGVLLWTGFSGGILMTSAVMKIGVKGIFLCLSGLLPHFLCYVAVYLVVLWYLLQYPHGRWNMTKTVYCVLLMLLGILMECYINPVLLKMFIRML